MLSDVCRVHCEYSWRPKLLEARRTGRSRPGVYGLELSRSVRRVQGLGHIVAASRLQRVMFVLLLLNAVTRWQSGWDAGRISASSLLSATLGMLLTHMCLCHQTV